MRWLNRAKAVSKSNSIDLVTQADRQAQAALLRVVRGAYPRHAVLAEEGGLPVPTQGAERWIVDPLDGTTNFVHGFPQFCVSIAFERDGVIELGVILDAFHRECFVARRGRGARLNGRRIRVSGCRRLGNSLVGTGFPYDRRERAVFYLAFYEAFTRRTQGVRRAGAAALDLAWVGCGRLDGFWEFGLKAWDVAAGALVVKEAGGRVTGMEGGPLGLDEGKIVASNGLIHGELLKTISATMPRAKRRQAALAPL